MFEKKGPGFFGVETSSSGGFGDPSRPYGGRDYVEPVSIGGEVGSQSHDMECQATPPMEGGTELLSGRRSKGGHASTAADTWDR